MRTHPASRFLSALALAALGAALSYWLVPHEQQAVQDHLLGFPQANMTTHHLRPLALGCLCFLPALGAICYAFAGTLDRYLARQMLTAVGLTFFALVVIWVLLDLNNNLGEFQEAEDTAAFLLRYYGVVIGSVFVLLAPFALLLGLLFALGKLSSNREIISMLQTGRSLVRVIAPLTSVGLLLTIACFLFNYHLGPWGEGYQEALIEEVREGSTSQARNVLYHNGETRRTWMVGRFPYDYNSRSAPLRDIQITNKDENGAIVSRFKAPLANWNPDTGAWTFQHGELLTLPSGPPSQDIASLMPLFSKTPSPLIHTDWPETPWQIVNPGLQARYLGVPGLKSWLNNNAELDWVDRRPFITQWYFRWAQPWICLVVVLLATPLGIVFSRRGVAGGVAVAVFLAAMMLFSTEVFLALGDSGYMPPVLAAWATNIVFTGIALFLLWRRLHGQSIYQSLKRVLHMGE
jgi:lipopolysaccharide export system permease protein